ncbi:rod shape-determining protein MreC [Candidatus Omnitrophota bacterium]
MIKTKKRTALLFLGLIAAFLFISQPPFIQSIESFVVDSFKAPLRFASDIFFSLTSFASYKKTLEENSDLKAEVAVLQSQIVSFEEALKENKRLKKLLSFKNQASFQTVAASVIGRDPSNWNSNLLLDSGKNNGISKDAIVIAEGGLVGKIVEVGNSTSRVLLINDTNLNVAAVIQRNRDEGIVSGTLGRQCRMSYLSPSSDVQSGDFVITSGLGGVFPKGILIGKVLDVFEDSSRLMRSCTIEPSVNLFRLEEVLVFKK